MGAPPREPMAGLSIPNACSALLTLRRMVQAATLSPSTRSVGVREELEAVQKLLCIRRLEHLADHHDEVVRRPLRAGQALAFGIENLQGETPSGRMLPALVESRM